MPQDSVDTPVTPVQRAQHVVNKIEGLCGLRGANQFQLFDVTRGVAGYNDPIVPSIILALGIDKLATKTVGTALSTPTVVACNDEQKLADRVEDWSAKCLALQVNFDDPPRSRRDEDVYRLAVMLRRPIAIFHGVPEDDNVNLTMLAVCEPTACVKGVTSVRGLATRACELHAQAY